MVGLPLQPRYRLAAGVRLEVLPDCALLFSEPDQLLHRLEGSSVALAQRLETGATLVELAQSVSSQGVAGAVATEWVAAFLHQVAGFGLIAVIPTSPLQPTVRTQNFRIAGVSLTVHYGSEQLFELVGSSFSRLQDHAASGGHSYRLSKAGEWVVFGKDSDPPQLLTTSTVAVRLKGAIIEDVLNAQGHVAALHAACLAGNHGAILLLGPPGAGKSMISLALLQRGFRFSSDDVTLVTRDGAVVGVSMPPGVKESAWTLTERFGISLSGLPTHLRPDGGRVRFYPVPDRFLEGPSRVRAVVRLNRKAGAELALDPLPRDEALRTLFQGGRSSSGRCSIETMHVLAQLVGQADCFELRYAEAADAAGLLAEYDRG